MNNSIKTIQYQITFNLDGKERGEISDGYHSFAELYEHRHALFIVCCRSNPALAWKSWLHDDGSDYPGWFIAGLNLPGGNVTYHLPSRLWDELNVRELERAPEWDGHTSRDVIERLKKFQPLHDHGQ